jgi:replicative DNA helicase
VVLARGTSIDALKYGDTGKTERLVRGKASASEKEPESPPRSKRNSTGRKSSSAETEKLFISSVLRAKDMNEAMKQGITPEMFRAYENEWTFIHNYYDKYRQIPSVIIFKRTFRFFDVSDTDDIHYLANEIRTQHVQRGLTDTMRATAELLASGSVDGAVTHMHSNILRVASNLGVFNDGDIFTDFDDILDSFEDAADRAARDGSSGVPIGLKSMDKRTGGGKPGELTIVAARLGVGKSFVMMKWAAEAVKRKKKVLFVSLEMPRDQVTGRIISLLAAEGGLLIRNTDLTQGKNFNREEVKSFLQKIKTQFNGACHVAERQKGGTSVTTISAMIERHKPDIVFIDYITLMTTKGEKNWSSIGALSADLKGLALDYRIPIVAAAQINRNGVSKKGEPPNSEEIAQSDQIGMDADTIITVGDPSPSCRAIRIAKNRHGKSGNVFYVDFRPGEGILKEISYERLQEIKAEDLEANVAGDEDDDDDE